MQAVKRKKRLPGNPGGPGTEVIRVYRDGLQVEKVTLSQKKPQMIIYAEAAAAAAEIYKDLEPEEAEAARLDRAARYILNSGFYYIAKLAEVDQDAARELLSDLLESVSPKTETGKSEFNIYAI